MHIADKKDEEMKEDVSQNAGDVLYSGDDEHVTVRKHTEEAISSGVSIPESTISKTSSIDKKKRRGFTSAFGAVTAKLGVGDGALENSKDVNAGSREELNAADTDVLPRKVEKENSGDDVVSASGIAAGTIDDSGTTGETVDADDTRVMNADKIASAVGAAGTAGTGGNDGNGGRGGADQELDGKPKKKLGRGAKIAIAIAAGIIAAACVIGGGYVAKANSYEGKFLPKTVLQGVNVEGKTATEAYDELTKSVSGLTISIKDGDGSTSEIKGSDVNLVADKDVVDKVLAKQSKWDWLSAAMGPENKTEIGVTYDEKKLETIIGNLECVSGTKRTDPVNATVAYNENAQKFEAVPEKMGDKADGTVLLEEAKNAIKEGKNTVIDAAKTFAEPKLKADSNEMKTLLGKLNDTLEKKISYNIDMIDNAETLTKDQIASFITVDAEKLEMGYNEEPIKAWLKEMGKKYDTAGTERSYTSKATGKTVTIPAGSSTYGWITDEAAMLPVVKECLASNESTVNRDFEYQQKAAGPKGGAEWGSTYAEVDITQQHCWYYQNGEVAWESACVTGYEYNERRTPSGLWSIIYKSAPCRLRGPMQSDGKYEWDTMVDEFICITPDGCGFHDANWQPSFGGSRYLTSGGGSHGCVNLPPAKADALYGLISVGDPTIIYRE